MSYVTLVQAKTHLNIAVSTYDARLQTFIDSAESLIGRKVGPLVPTVGTEWYDGGSTTIVLDRSPVFGVSDVEESYGTFTRILTATPLDGTSFSAYAYTVDENGVLIRRSSGIATAFAGGKRSVKVTYSAGWSPVPERLRLAVLETVRHLWETQRGNSPSQGPEDVYTDSLAYVLPRRVLELIADDRTIGIA